MSLKERRRGVRRHAAERAGLSQAQVRAIAQAIRRGEARFLLNDTISKAWYAVVVNGRPWIAIYSRTLGEVVTFLSPERPGCTISPELWNQVLDYAATTQ